MYMSGWFVIGQTATSSSLVISTRATPGFSNVSRPAYASEPWPRATNSPGGSFMPRTVRRREARLPGRTAVRRRVPPTRLRVAARGGLRAGRPDAPGLPRRHRGPRGRDRRRRPGGNCLLRGGARRVHGARRGDVDGGVARAHAREAGGRLHRRDAAAPVDCLRGRRGARRARRCSGCRGSLADDERALAEQPAVLAEAEGASAGPDVPRVAAGLERARRAAEPPPRGKLEVRARGPPAPDGVAVEPELDVVVTGVAGWAPGEER